MHRSSNKPSCAGGGELHGDLRLRWILLRTVLPWSLASHQSRRLVGRCSFAALMPVPEAAVDEDGGFVFGEKNVHGNGFGLSSVECRVSNDDRNADVEAETVAESVKETADDLFGRGVFAADAAHVPGTAFGCETVFVQSLNLKSKGI
jgi:hypothetical protein